MLAREVYPQRTSTDAQLFFRHYGKLLTAFTKWVWFNRLDKVKGPVVYGGPVLALEHVPFSCGQLAQGYADEDIRKFNQAS